ncbi:hypothetical protein [Clostridium muellerianum]|nr:hypothetical protein [Clostridium muellerianum]
MKLNKEKEKLSESILNWSMGSDKFLNIRSLPYNSAEIFIKVIMYYVLNNKKIAYITNETSNKVDVIEKIKKYTEFRNYAYLRGSKIQSSALLKVGNLYNICSLREKFDLIIYDDINSFPIKNAHETVNFISKISKYNTKVITYAVESILRSQKEFLLPVKDNKNPVIEPRTILTRIDINKDIPFMVYDYLKWSISCGRKVIIYVPDKEKVQKVHVYVKRYCLSFTKSVMKLYKENDYNINKRIINNFEKIKNSIVITNSFYEVFSNIKNTDIMVYFADNPEFDYKKLIYLCASVGRSERDLKGEVIFLANEETEDMEKAKNMTRNFNKEAWEMGLLKI